MVNLRIDNSASPMNPNDAIDLIVGFFKTHLPYFQIEQKYNKPEGYYGVKFINQDTKIFIGSGRGFLESYINIDGEDMPLWKLDRKITQIESLNEQNIKYVLYIINDFFK